MSSTDEGGAPARREAGAAESQAPSGGFRKGAFGVTGSGDTSGFGGLVRVEPGGAVALHSTDRPYGGWFDEVTDGTCGSSAVTATSSRMRRR